MVKARKKGQKTYGYFIKVSSLMDLARGSCSLGSGASHINAIRQGGKYRLFAVGERLEDTRLIYCFDVDSKGDMLTYNPNAEQEQCEFRNYARALPEDYKSYRIPVLELSKSLYSSRSRLADHTNLVEVKGVAQLAKAVISDTSGRTDAVNLYAFPYRSRQILGTFSLFRDGASKTFAYAIADSQERFSYLRYNYQNDSVEFCRGTAEKSLIYLRIINLEAPFPFFKPE